MKNRINFINQMDLLFLNAINDLEDNYGIIRCSSSFPQSNTCISFYALLIELFSCKMKGGVAVLWAENTNASVKLSAVCDLGPQCIAFLTYFLLYSLFIACVTDP